MQYRVGEKIKPMTDFIERSIIQSKQDKKLFRDVHGIILVDKPLGLSSNHALQTVRKRLFAKKAGHAGTLDPLATGMLPICFGEATKCAGLMLGHRKAYRAIFKLGVTTDSGDREGDILQTREIDSNLTLNKIEQLIEQFRGSITQRPPAHSALRVGKIRAYELARRGEKIELPLRQVEIFRYEVLRFDHDEIEVEVECGSGTYIRSLATDLGEALACGAHVKQLRRLWVDPFQAMPMLELANFDHIDDAILKTHLLPLDAGLLHWPRIDLNSTDSLRVQRGQTFEWPHESPQVPARAYSNQGVLIALIQPSNGKVSILRGFCLS